MIYNIGIRQISSKLSKKWLEIRGNIKVDGIGARKRIAVLDRNNMHIKAMRYSDNNGLWFWRVSERAYPLRERKNRFLVLALDNAKTFNAKAYDYISPVLVEITINIGG